MNKLKNNADIPNKSGNHITSDVMKEVTWINKTKDLSKLSRGELEHYERFWSNVEKYKM